MGRSDRYISDTFQWRSKLAIRLSCTKLQAATHSMIIYYIAVGLLLLQQHFNMSPR